MNVLLVETKKEYTKSLCVILQPQIYRGIRSIYEDAQEIKTSNKLRTFQKLLEGIPKWDRVTLSQEYERISKDSNCSYLGELITAVFVCYTKVLTAVQVGVKRARVDLDVPAPEIFIHKCYIECARRFWKEPYLLSTKISTHEYQRNLRISEKMINESIEETIRSLLPIQHIMSQYLGKSSDFQSEVSSVLSERTESSFHTSLRDVIRNDIVAPLLSHPEENENARTISVEPVLSQFVDETDDGENIGYTTQKFIDETDESEVEITFNSTPTMTIQETPLKREEDEETNAIENCVEKTINLTGSHPTLNKKEIVQVEHVLEKQNIDDKHNLALESFEDTNHITINQDTNHITKEEHNYIHDDDLQNDKNMNIVETRAESTKGETTRQLLQSPQEEMEYEDATHVSNHTDETVQDPLHLEAETEQVQVPSETTTPQTQESQLETREETTQVVAPVENFPQTSLEAPLETLEETTEVAPVEALSQTSLDTIAQTSLDTIEGIKQETSHKKGSLETLPEDTIEGDERDKIIEDDNENDPLVQDHVAGNEHILQTLQQEIKNLEKTFVNQMPLFADAGKI